MHRCTNAETEIQLKTSFCRGQRDGQRIYENNRQLVHKIFRKQRKTGKNTDTTDRSALPTNAVSNKYERMAHSVLSIIKLITKFTKCSSNTLVTYM